MSYAKTVSVAIGLWFVVLFLLSVLHECSPGADLVFVAAPGAEMVDPYNLERFVQAQNPVYESVCAELRRGGKKSHWMWFIFPQVKGLGYSTTTRRFAISSREEAEAYLNHPVLGPRLWECTRLVMLIPSGIRIHEIFGYPDYLKFHSCMTLFAQVAQDNQIFKDALDRHFNGELDAATIERL